jgi:tripartite-type tricarboxylate transporter receptor subunit TctC
MTVARHILAAMLVAAVCTVPARADEFPTRGVRIEVGAAAGGPVDTAARVLGERLSERWKQPVTVENRVGASEMIATEYVSKAAPDGLTLLMASINVVTINPVVFPRIQYDPVNGLAPIVLATTNPMVFVSSARTGFASLRQLIEGARARPEQVSWSSPGLATNNHIAGEWFAADAGIRLFHVPYKGGPAAINAVVAGEVPLALVSLVQAIPFAKSPQVHILAVTTGRRSVLAPDWPTVSELAVPGFDLAVQTALFAPGGTAPAIVTKINADVMQILRAPETRERLAGMGVEPGGSTPEELVTLIRNGRAKIQQVVDRAGIRVQQ